MIQEGFYTEIGFLNAVSYITKSNSTEYNYKEICLHSTGFVFESDKPESQLVNFRQISKEALIEKIADIAKDLGYEQGDVIDIGNSWVRTFHKVCHVGVRGNKFQVIARNPEGHKFYLMEDNKWNPTETKQERTVKKEETIIKPKPSNAYKKGDRVVIRNDGMVYTTYRGLYVSVWGSEITRVGGDNGDIGVVKECFINPSDEHRTLVALDIEGGGQCVINVDGVELVKEPETKKSEIGWRTKYPIGSYVRLVKSINTMNGVLEKDTIGRVINHEPIDYPRNLPIQIEVESNSKPLHWPDLNEIEPYAMTAADIQRVGRHDRSLIPSWAMPQYPIKHQHLLTSTPTKSQSGKVELPKKKKKTKSRRDLVTKQVTKLNI